MGSLACTIVVILMVVLVASAAAKSAQKSRIRNLEREVYEAELKLLKRYYEDD